MKIYYLIILIFLMWGCSSRHEVQSLYPTRIMYDPNKNEDYYFSQIGNIQESGGDFYLSDYVNNHIIVVNNNFEWLYTFGDTGSGPGEFQEGASFYVYNNLVYVYDYGGIRINVFTTFGEFDRIIPISTELLMGFHNRFAILDDKIYLPPFYQGESKTKFIILDLNGNLQGSINHKIDYDDVIGDYNHRSILSYKDQLIVVNHIAPFIEIYSKEGDLIDVFDLSGIHELDGLWDHYQQSIIKNRYSRNTTTIFSDAYIEGAFLYLLCAPWPGRDNYSYIIKLSLTQQPLNLDEIFKIQGTEQIMRLFSHIAILKNQLIAVEGFSGKIFEFDLEELE